MSELVVVGLSHRTAPVELRERLSVQFSDLPAELRTLCENGPFREALLVSTCNRVELYASTTAAPEAIRAAHTYLASRADQPIDTVLYDHAGPEAVRHAFRVAASLDSLVVGEPQILGQVKEAYEAATAAGTLGNLLGRCFTRAFAVAKRVRSETGIAEGTVSVSSIAVELARKIFGEMTGRRVLLLGAGEMGEAAAKSLAQTGAELRVVNRSFEKAVKLAGDCGGEAREYEQLPTELVKADVVITSTSTKRFVLTEDLMKDVVRGRRHRPLFLIDIAVPRDVDPRVGDLDGVFLYDVDDLQKVAEENLRSRRREAEAAERIVEVEVAEFQAWKRSLELTPTIVGLRERFLATVRAELEKSASKMTSLSEADRKALDRTADAIVGKLLHAPISALKSGDPEADGPVLIDTTRRLFALDEPAKEAETKPAAAPRPSTPAPAGTGESK